MSLHQYILVKRVLLAIRLMHRGVGATQAALESGFSDYSCFDKAFVKAIGLSPREYLRRINESDRIIPRPPAARRSSFPLAIPPTRITADSPSAACTPTKMQRR